jgi:hypothetical protein
VISLLTAVLWLVMLGWLARGGPFEGVGVGESQMSRRDFWAHIGFLTSLAAFLVSLFIGQPRWLQLSALIVMAPSVVVMGLEKRKRRR